MIEIIMLTIIITTLIIMLYLGFRFYIFMVLGVAIGIIISKKITQPRHTQWLYISKKDNTKLVLSVLRILFFSLMSISIFIVYIHPSYAPPIKPIGYYILTAVASGMLCSSIFIKIKLAQKKYSFELFQILLLATITYFSTQLAVYPYSGIGSIDTINNIFRVSGDISIIQLINEGRIPQGIRYSYFPGHYLLAYITPIVSNFSPELMYYYLGGFIGTLVIPSIYIIGRRLTEKIHFAIIIALITATGLDYYNYWISHPHQFTYAFPLAVLSFGILVLYALTTDLKYVIVMIVLYTMLVISHDYTTVLFTFGIISIYIAINFFKIYNPNEYSKFHLSYFILVLMISIMFVQFIYHSQDIVVFTRAFKEYLENIFSSEFSNPGMYSKTSWKYIFTNTLSSTILLMLATPGLIYTFERIFNIQKKIDDTAIQTIESNLIIFLLFGMYYVSLIVVGILLKSHYLMPQRIYVLLQVFSLVYLSGYTLRLLLNSKEKIAIMTLMLLILLSFFSQTTIIAGFESSPFLSSIPFVKTYYTPQEIASGIWVNSKLKLNSTIYTSPTLIPQALLVKINAQEFLEGINLKNMPVSLGDNNSCRYNLRALYKEGDTSTLYIWLDKYDSITGVQPKYSGKFGTAIRCHVTIGTDMVSLARSTIYSNNIIMVFEY